MKLAKREIAWQREGQFAAAINYQVEDLPPGQNAIIIKVHDDWRVLYSENGVDGEWEDRYVSADIAALICSGDVPNAEGAVSTIRPPLPSVLSQPSPNRPLTFRGGECNIWSRQGVNDSNVLGTIGEFFWSSTGELFVPIIKLRKP